MIRRASSLLILIVASLFAVSCATAPRTALATSPKGNETTAVAAPPAKNGPPASNGPTQPSQAPAAQSSAAEASGQDGLIRKGNISVTEAFYEKTLSDIRSLIATLNTIIANEDYETWLTYLTPEYRRTFSNPDTLTSLSSMPLLEKKGIQLHSLKDYFLDVVVPSRTDAQVDDVDFLSKDHVRAIAIIDGQRYILYDLQLLNGSWKIGVS